ncbi:uncharacterized protein Z518_10166 [Rhinocladiella mackenziei CBS 650.93]|uniref:Rhinocladiella mackenziei CBS 650.93 unplaced genomic scaffold supercont1.8, whole genome shotgun sequence n=1 Tax=Rhinocladiella mackenziei CBS 650.93 TaxID=1442369 RepID=A0A0D2IWV6_9EURO|nr:uncharacterized protein Z518_10166 [Rhinocladiella mackenziei CBS 650.93]KIX01100.1 hypothetical protein Z518_10166 [Rhinocladiella mackenziei CBS 650.93]
MAEALSAASGVAGLISLSVQLFDGCVKGFVLLSAAQGLGSRAEVFNCQLEWEHYHLHRWASVVGLFKEPPELNVPNLPLAERTLRTLEQILTNAEQLRTHYDLTIDVTDEELKSIQSPKRLFGGILNSAAHTFVSDTAKVYQRRVSSWKKLKWAAVDQQKLASLIQDIHFFNEQLRSTLHRVEESQYRGASSDTLRSIITQTNDEKLLQVVANKLSSFDAAVQASARLKQRGLLLEVWQEQDQNDDGDTSTLVARTDGIMPRSSPTSSNQTMKRKVLPVKRAPRSSCLLDFKLLRRTEDKTNIGVIREMAIFDQAQVILEWKGLPEHLEKRLKHRVEAVADFLSGVNDPTFHSLTCLGYVKEPKTSNYAYVFQPPLKESFSTKTLADLLQGDIVLPSINQRLTLAATLFETVLQFHTAGWLHKSIRSDNILFFQPADRPWTGTHSLPDAYLGGYDFARSDNILETTEPPVGHEPARLYRHPLSLTRERMAYCKAFDLYSLGCVLLEVGLWRPMLVMLADWTQQKPSGKNDYCLPPRSVIVDPSTVSNWHLILEEKESFLTSTQSGCIADELRFCMGDRYSRIVSDCLSEASKLITEGDEEEEEQDDSGRESSLDIQIASLRALRSMLEHV